MTLPGWLLTKPALYAGAAVLVLGSGATWMAVRDARIRREEDAKLQAKQFASALATAHAAVVAKDSVIRQDSILRVEQEQRTNAVALRVHSAGISYTTARSSIPPQPAGTPAGMVLVPAAFIAASDSLAALVPALMATIVAERASSQNLIDSMKAKSVLQDSVAALQQKQIVALQVQVKNAGPGITKKAGYAVIGGGLVYLLDKVVVPLLKKH